MSSKSNRELKMAVEKKIAELRQKAQKVAAEILQEQANWFAGYQSDLLGDFETFRFACRRYGDFLSIEVARPFVNDEKFAATISLGGQTVIRLHRGRGPTMTGEINLYAMLASQNSAMCARWDSNIFPRGFEYVVRKPQPHKKSCMSNFVHIPMTSDKVHDFDRVSNGYVGNLIERETLHTIFGCATPAEDDVVYIGRAIILCPFGCGVSVIGKIHSELERGFEARLPHIGDENEQQR